MPDNDSHTTETDGKHSIRNMLMVEMDVLNLLVKMAHAKKWPIKEALVGMRSTVGQATEDEDTLRAYRDRLDVLIQGLN